MKIVHWDCDILETPGASDAPGDVGFGLLDDHPEHDGCGETKAIPVSQVRHERGIRKGPNSIGGRTGGCLPSEDVLGMVVTQVDFGSSSKGNTASLVVNHLHPLRFCIN